MPETTSQDSRRAIVTGGASGIGAAAVSLLEAEGYTVQILDLVAGFDVSDPTRWSEIGPVELACLNAGVATGEPRDVALLTDAQYRRAVGVNLDGVVFGVRRMAQVMTDGGSIVVTASLAALMPHPNDPVYALAKHAVIGFVRSIAPQLVDRGIRINAVCPGFTDTPILFDELREAAAEWGIPLLAPGDVARALLAAATSGETGQAWVVQPGRDPLVYGFRGVPGPR